jgi:UDP-N-acetylglucosamine--N-acetylmuramyl-(pentapeptide) pyrophosphoryl-undecaprenol N-acetylglucosamine transferase
MTGGGTLGPVTPLIAIAKEWQRVEPDVTVYWIGTQGGPERELVERYNYDFRSLMVPKLSRHKWWTWPVILPMLFVSCVKAYKMLQELQPDIVFTAGGYTSVPIVWMAKLLGIPSWVHQLDVQAGLANRLMAPVASRVSVTWEESAEYFGTEKTLVVGGMARPEIRQGSRELFLRDHKLDPNRPTVLVFGGGTGAVEINNAMKVIAREILSQMNVIHLTGKDKMTEAFQDFGPGYFATEFLNEDMKHADRKSVV